ncbi:CapA family protein [Tepidimicrobium xylanilyticum]|uniref:Poly-gamma-glutamate synthesis protein (Capsule biosynthesis protein) n=1 Tax=Tepidimicrobium xylanilyticum TaxID=1123352 RepID=A0A1H2VE25_9FIRM|nr:CapA family protein [Tepidimicrobium xylanilyticum]GMG96660.1 metallophosphatase [Tepidimicrobium xylanilyticum]SDW66587.1 poly-gamma-glutamate synthesis protein (capsule biosynthesis protein) [Tepidimicrobium xylanilyticum]
MKKRNIIIPSLLLLLFSLFIINQFLLNITKIHNGTSQEENGFLSPLPESEIPQEEEEKITTATLLAVGDIMFHMPQIKSAYNPVDNTYDFNDVFRYVRKYIDSADLSIANFETVVAGNERGFSGFPRFNSPEETLKAIKNAGFNILTTANNHALDQGKEGLLKTIEFIEREGMKNLGTYREPSDQLLIENINGIKVALLSYSYGFNGLEYSLTEEELSYLVNRIDENRIKEDILKAKGHDSDIIVVCIHWGNEYEREPSEFQVELGKKMIEWGANIILGGHPHVVQRSEIVHYGGKDNFIIYSMGNFLSNQRRENVNTKYAEDGIMVKILLEKDLIRDETIIKDITYIPTWVRRYNDNGVKYEILPIVDFLEDEGLYSIISEKERKRIEESYHDTLEKMAQN